MPSVGSPRLVTKITSKWPSFTMANPPHPVWNSGAHCEGLWQNFFGICAKGNVFLEPDSVRWLSQKLHSLYAHQQGKAVPVAEVLFWRLKARTFLIHHLPYQASNTNQTEALQEGTALLLSQMSRYIFWETVFVKFKLPPKRLLLLVRI
jgi:hypothetical protein